MASSMRLQHSMACTQLFCMAEETSDPVEMLIGDGGGVKVGVVETGGLGVYSNGKWPASKARVASSRGIPTGGP